MAQRVKKHKRKKSPEYRADCPYCEEEQRCIYGDVTYECVDCGGFFLLVDNDDDGRSMLDKTIEVTEKVVKLANIAISAVETVQRMRKVR